MEVTARPVGREVGSLLVGDDGRTTWTAAGQPEQRDQRRSQQPDTDFTAQVGTLEGTSDTGKDGAPDLRMVPLKRRENDGPLSFTQSPLMLTQNHKQGPLIPKLDKAGLQATSEGYTWTFEDILALRYNGVQSINNV